MTISTSRTGRNTIGELVELAWHQSGLVEMGQSPSASQKAYGRKRLQVHLDNLEVIGNKVRAITNLDVPLFTGVSTYGLSTTVRDVGPVATYIQPDDDLLAPTGALTLKLLSRDEYEAIGDYATTSTPSSFYPDRSGQYIELKVWPPPDADGTVRLKAFRFLADLDSDNVTLELEPHWEEYLLLWLCEQITVATGGTPERATYFRRQAQAARDYAEEASADQGDGAITLGAC